MKKHYRTPKPQTQRINLLFPIQIPIRYNDPRRQRQNRKHFDLFTCLNNLLFAYAVSSSGIRIQKIEQRSSSLFLWKLNGKSAWNIRIQIVRWSVKKFTLCLTFNLLYNFSVGNTFSWSHFFHGVRYVWFIYYSFLTFHLRQSIGFFIYDWQKWIFHMSRNMYNARSYRVKKNRKFWTISTMSYVLKSFMNN